MNYDKQITNKADAVRFVVDLYEAGKLFHFDDDPADIYHIQTGEPLCKLADVEPLRQRVAELFMFIDPFEIALALTDD